MPNHDTLPTLLPRSELHPRALFLHKHLTWRLNMLLLTDVINLVRDHLLSLDPAALVKLLDHLVDHVLSDLLRVLPTRIKVSGIFWISLHLVSRRTINRSLDPDGLSLHMLMID